MSVAGARDAAALLGPDRTDRPIVLGLWRADTGIVRAGFRAQARLLRTVPTDRRADSTARIAAVCFAGADGVTAHSTTTSGLVVDDVFSLGGAPVYGDDSENKREGTQDLGHHGRLLYGL
jgi:hypothetical protein